MITDPFHETNVDMGDNTTYRNPFELERSTETSI